MDTVVMVKIIKDRQKIGQLATFIAERPLKRDILKCGLDGSLHFFKMNKVVQDIEFRMGKPDCMYFSFLDQGSTQVTNLTGAAKELINSFRK